MTPSLSCWTNRERASTETPSTSSWTISTTSLGLPSRRFTRLIRNIWWIRPDMKSSAPFTIAQHERTPIWV